MEVVRVHTKWTVCMHQAILSGGRGLSAGILVFVVVLRHVGQLQHELVRISEKQPRRTNP
eukprot:4968412-Amphidinium_carterae.2